MTNAYEDLSVQFRAGFASSESTKRALHDLGNQNTAINSDDGDTMQISVFVAEGISAPRGAFSILTESRITIKRVSIHGVETTNSGGPDDDDEETPTLTNLKLPDFEAPIIVHKGGKKFNLYQAANDLNGFVNDGEAHFEIKYSSAGVKKGVTYHPIFNEPQESTPEKPIRSKPNTVYSFASHIYFSVDVDLKIEHFLLPKTPHVGDTIEVQIFDTGDGSDFIDGVVFGFIPPDNDKINGLLKPKGHLIRGDSMRAVWTDNADIGWSISINNASIE